MSLRGRRLRVPLRAVVTLLAAGLQCIRTTEQDATIAGDAANWHSLALHFQASAMLIEALRAATTCIRLGSAANQDTVAKCNTLAGSILAVNMGRDHAALVHFRNAAALAPSVSSYSNVGLAMSRLYLNDLSGDWYKKALSHADGTSADTQGALGTARSPEWVDTLNRFAEARQVVCAEWHLLPSRMHLLLETTAQAIAQGEAAISPFLAMSLPIPAPQVLSVTSSHALRAVRAAARERAEKADQGAAAARAQAEAEAGIAGQELPDDDGAVGYYYNGDRQRPTRGRGRQGQQGGPPTGFPFPWGPARMPLVLSGRRAGGMGAVRRLRVAYLGAHFDAGKPKTRGGWMDGWIDLFVCLFIYVCMHACMHACMYVCMYVCISLSAVCMYVCAYIY